jgi:hypothetical protein
LNNSSNTFTLSQQLRFFSVIILWMTSWQPQYFIFQTDFLVKTLQACIFSPCSHIRVCHTHFQLLHFTILTTTEDKFILWRPFKSVYQLLRIRPFGLFQLRCASEIINLCNKQARFFGRVITLT